MAIVERGHWGGNGGTNSFRVPEPLTSITVRYADHGGRQLISGLKFVTSNRTYAQGQTSGGLSTTWDLTGKTVYSVTGGYGDQGYIPGRYLLEGLKIVTTDETTFSAGSFNAREETFEPTKFAGFAGESGSYVDRLGVLEETSAAEVEVALDSSQTPKITVNAVGAIRFGHGDKLTWKHSPSSQDSFEFTQIAFYTDKEETQRVGGWSSVDPIQQEPGFLYQFNTTTAACIEIQESGTPTVETDYWYKLWLKSGDRTFILDPEVINFVKRNH